LKGLSAVDDDVRCRRETEGKRTSRHELNVRLNGWVDGRHKVNSVTDYTYK